jgi:hypothetical protein
MRGKYTPTSRGSQVSALGEKGMDGFTNPEASLAVNCNGRSEQAPALKSENSQL